MCVLCFVVVAASASAQTLSCALLRRVRASSPPPSSRPLSPRVCVCARAFLCTETKWKKVHANDRRAGVHSLARARARIACLLRMQHTHTQQYRAARRALCACAPARSLVFALVSCCCAVRVFESMRRRPPGAEEAKFAPPLLFLGLRAANFCSLVSAPNSVPIRVAVRARALSLATAPERRAATLDRGRQPAATRDISHAGRANQSAWGCSQLNLAVGNLRQASGAVRTPEARRDQICLPSA